MTTGRCTGYRWQSFGRGEVKGAADMAPVRGMSGTSLCWTQVGPARHKQTHPAPKLSPLEEFVTPL